MCVPVLPGSATRGAAGRGEGQEDGEQAPRRAGTEAQVGGGDKEEEDPAGGENMV